ncbi:MAG: iron chelate uptake ABC transporter family permease subunit, partial [Atribacterota bacterium]|nr:iron chelate uptake ABC transporter family permease subunit [Atribacterota bacterium]
TALMVLFSKEFQSIMFDRKMAEASGIPTKPFYCLILSLAEVAVSLSLKLLGGLLIFALIVNPTSTVYLFFYNFEKIIIFSHLLGVGYCIIGIFVSFLLDFPIGSLVAIVSTLFFVIAVTLSLKRKRG